VAHLHFFQTHNAQQKNVKEPPSQLTHDSRINKQKHNDGKNIRLKGER
jgi:hypothetical protein